MSYEMTLYILVVTFCDNLQKSFKKIYIYALQQNFYFSFFKCAGNEVKPDKNGILLTVKQSRFHETQ